jgi:orotate phosphoribosyltransferase
MMIDVGALLDETGAVRRGHFLLTSGRHSDVYFEKFRLLERPRVVSALAEAIAARFPAVDRVAGPTTGGILIAFEVARQLGCQALYIESEDGHRVIRRGAEIERGAKTLIVDDVLTTGRSIREVAAVLGEAGAIVTGAAVLIDRSEGELDLGFPLFAAHRVEAVSYAPDAVPEWLAAMPLEKPGTRPRS